MRLGLIAIALVVTLIAPISAATWWPDSLTQPPQQQTATEEESAEENVTENQPVVAVVPAPVPVPVPAPARASAEGPDHEIARYTFWLTVFTAFLGAATIILALIAAVQVIYFARKERAFVFQKNIDVQFIETPAGAVREWAFAVAWENSGGTPTKALRYRVSHDLRDTPFPIGYLFADKPGDKDLFAVLGPGGVISCLPIYIHVVDIRQVQEGKQHLYIWGWAKYRTAFWLSRLHRTKFCIQIVVQPLSEGRARVGMPLHEEHNTAN